MKAARPGTPLVARLMARIEQGPACWLWNGYVHPTTGYGMFTIKGVGSRPAHRLVYEELVGPIPEGLEIDHLCRVRHCVNPDHLEPVTRHTNIIRGDGPRITRERAARRTHCKHGHEYAVVGRYSGYRCAECGRQQARRLQQGRRAA